MTRFHFAGALALGTALIFSAAIVGPAQATTTEPVDVTAPAVETPAPEVEPTTEPAETTEPEAPALQPGTARSGVSAASATAVVDGGLKRVRLFTGSVNWSVDGLGVNEGSSGDLQVEKPAGATVTAAFLMTAASSAHEEPTDITLATEAVAFSLSATETLSTFGFTNYFADVTSIVKPLVDAGTGTINLTVDEGTFTDQIEGTSLVVIFDDPAVNVASIAIYFGTSDPAGDNFTMAFNALSAPQTQDLRMSMGSAFSYGSDQGSRVLVNGQVLSEQAGHFDDCDQFVAGVEDQGEWLCSDRALLTVGGVGDSLTNPTVGGAWSTTADDELYSLSPFVEVGDTQIDVVTSNASADDNIFMAVFYLDEIEVFAEGQLAETGATETLWLAGFGAAILLAGMVFLVLGRRRSVTSL